MGTNHRGGSPGFVRVASNKPGPGGCTLVYPEFSGNRLYQTLGNLYTTTPKPAWSSRTSTPATSCT